MVAADVSSEQTFKPITSACIVQYPLLLGAGIDLLSFWGHYVHLMGSLIIHGHDSFIKPIR